MCFVSISIFNPLKKRFKIIISFTLLAVILFAAVPKVYIHALLGHHHSFIKTTPNDVVSSIEDAKDCDFEKFDTPVYYTVFKFILNFLPLKESKQTSFLYKQEPFKQHTYYISKLRGPPIS